MTTRVWLIRHGEPAEEVRRRCYGSLDPGLSANGRSQMEAAARSLASEPISAIYASPRRRTMESARIVRELPVETVPDLREIDFGDFEGLTYDEIAERYPDIYRQWMQAPTQVQFPHGECFAQMRTRVVRAFEAILACSEGQTVAIVTHGGVIRCLLAWALHMPDDCLFRLGQGYAAMNLVTWVEGVPTLELLNLVERRCPE